MVRKETRKGKQPHNSEISMIGVKDLA